MFNPSTDSIINLLVYKFWSAHAYPIVQKKSKKFIQSFNISPDDDDYSKWLSEYFVVARHRNLSKKKKKQKLFIVHTENKRTNFEWGKKETQGIIAQQLRLKKIRKQTRKKF